MVTAKRVRLFSNSFVSRYVQSRGVVAGYRTSDIPERADARDLTSLGYSIRRGAGDIVGALSTAAARKNQSE
jgi:ribosomal protein S12